MTDFVDVRWYHRWVTIDQSWLGEPVHRLHAVGHLTRWGARDRANRVNRLGIHVEVRRASNFRRNPTQ